MLCFFNRTKSIRNLGGLVIRKIKASPEFCPDIETLFTIAIYDKKGNILVLVGVSLSGQIPDNETLRNTQTIAIYDNYLTFFKH